MRFQLTTFVLLVFFAFSSLKADWPEFRGPLGNGHSSVKKVPLKWSNDSENISFRVPVAGLGWSSPSIIDNEIWITAADKSDNTLRAICLDLKSGKEIKNIVVFEKKSLGRVHSKNSHASPTVFIDNDLLYVHYGDFGTACLNRDGKIIWKKEIKCGHLHGPGGSPVVYEDKLIINFDGKDAQFVAALNKKTGDEIWRAKRTHVSPERFTGGKMVPISYSTPTLWKNDGKVQVISSGADHVAGYDVETGKEIWWAEYDGYSVVPRPTIGKGLVFVSSSYNRSVMKAIKLGQSGKAEIAWENRRSASKNPSPIIVGDEIYSVSDDGVATCFDVLSGKVHWKKRIGRAYSASPIFAQGRIYFLDETGTATVIEPGKEYSELAINKIKGRTLASLVPIEGGILLRTDKELLRIEAQ